MKQVFFTEKELAKGKELVRQGCVKSTLFSAGTYQVEVEEKGRTLWPFLQLGKEGEILDDFCSCQEKRGRCCHLAAAYLSLFKEGNIPLHVRWQRSFWNALCYIASHHHGYRSDTLVHDTKKWQAKLINDQIVFTIEPLTSKARAILSEMIERRPVETEETSLKFSNLSEEEIEDWREGRPSRKLQYELSFWSDLSKWLFSMQEEGASYKIAFSPTKELPHTVDISFKEVVCSFYISQEDLLFLIPSLATVDSPLRIYQGKQQTLRDIEYDPVKKKLLLYFLDHLDEGKRLASTFHIGDFDYVPGKGFYRRSLDPLLSEAKVEPGRVDQFFQEHLPLLKRHLNIPIHEGIHPLHYNLVFDSEGVLHIQTYLFEKGDLCSAKSALFRNWAYIENKGFFYIQKAPFAQADTRIERKQISDFIKKYQSWLSNREGFHVHLANIESRLSYEVTDIGDLYFYSHIDLAEEEKDLIDFEEWIFLPGRGFFPKKMDGEETAIFAGKRVPKNEVAFFLRRHHLELGYVPNFFCTHAPVERVSWKIYAHEKGIRVEPQYLFFPSYENKKIIFFEEYIYVPHEGFTRIRGIPPYLERHLEEKVVDDKEALFVLEHLAEWKPWIDFVDPKLRAPREMTLEASKATCEENNEWNVDLFYRTEIGKISVYELWQAIEQGQKRIFSEAGVIDLTDSRFQWLSSFNKRRWKGKTKTLELGAVEWARVQAFEGLSMFSSEEQKQLPPFSLQGLQSTLRPYQQSGLHWLWFLYHNGLSGVLCDEMGLGKTHQAMALLAAVHNDSSLKKQKYLVVCPTSVLYHWQELLHKYLPGLKVCLFYGYARQAIKLEADYDVILTSYGTVRSEKKHLQTIPFTLAIYDELQQAKNPKSQIHRALCSFQVKMAVGLTGTPIENRIGDIKALFDLVLPGYFVSPASFQENFINPIEKEKNPEAMQRLARMVKPFVLRRKKKDVLLELPEKEEEIAYCDLSDLQLQMYREAFFSSQKEIRKEMELVDKSRAEMHIFALFSKLKQICDHPCLILGKIDQYTNFASGKWDLFVELLSEARESGQKVVVFTQYLQMLDILGKYLTSEGIEYAEIRGSTRNRGDQIRRFQQEPECEVFLGSLQAAGVGIELTAASVVIHYDRWWNPAKENQATDRVHRIGQSRGVQVFKLVTKKTIEERIHRLIEEKKGLLEQVVGFDDQDIVKRFTKQELLTLLTDLEKDLSP